MKTLLLYMVLLIFSIGADAQSGVGGGGQSNVGGGGSGSGATNGIVSGTTGTFSLSSFGGIDDDVTDNCANGSVAAFTAAVNGYSGPGVPTAIISPGTSNKAYKLATANNSCTFAFTRLGGVSVYLYANIDCAQTAQSCMQFGPSGQVSEITTENYTLSGRGMFLGGANLTLAGLYVEPGVAQFQVSRVQFGSSAATSTTGFGASNGTLGNCTNYSIYIDAPVATGMIDHVFDYIASSSTSSGGCGFANPNGAGTGSNTVFFEGNVVATAGAIAGGTQCGSQGIIDGGTLGVSLNNNVYGLGIPFRVQGIGHRFIGNQVDAAGCVAKGVSAAFQVGANGSATAVGPITLDSNIGQFSASGHTVFLMAIAGDSTATIAGASVIGNQNNDPVIAMFPATLACTPQGSACVVAANQGFTLVSPGLTGTNGAGWGVPPIANLVYANDSLGANLGSVSTGNAVTGRFSYLFCFVVETTRDAVSSTLPSCVVNFTDGFTSASVTKTVTLTDTSDLVGAEQSGFIAFNPTSGTAINISTTGYLSNTASAMKYSVRFFVMQY